MKQPSEVTILVEGNGYFANHDMYALNLVLLNPRHGIRITVIGTGSDAQEAYLNGSSRLRKYYSEKLKKILPVVRCGVDKVRIVSHLPEGVIYGYGDSIENAIIAAHRHLASVKDFLIQATLKRPTEPFIRLAAMDDNCIPLDDDHPWWMFWKRP
jgi:hypothetical protein